MFQHNNRFYEFLSISVRLGTSATAAATQWRELGPSLDRNLHFWYLCFIFLYAFDHTKYCNLHSWFRLGFIIVYFHLCRYALNHTLHCKCNLLELRISYLYLLQMDLFYIFSCAHIENYSVKSSLIPLYCIIAGNDVSRHSVLG